MMFVKSCYWNESFMILDSVFRIVFFGIEFNLFMVV